MAVKPILNIPDSRLSEKSHKVKEITPEVKKDIQDLLDTLMVAEDPEGAGLAAPQIGITKRICVVRQFFEDPLDPAKTLHEDIVLINPKIFSTSEETTIDWEGCLSVPDTYGKVERYSKIKVTAMDQDGNLIKLKADDLLARVIQHEIDHLDGILFTQRVVGQTLSEKALDQLFNGASLA